MHTNIVATKSLQDLTLIRNADCFKRSDAPHTTNNLISLHRNTLFLNRSGPTEYKFPEFRF